MKFTVNIFALQTIQRIILKYQKSQVYSLKKQTFFINYTRLSEPAVHLQLGRAVPSS